MSIIIDVQKTIYDCLSKQTGTNYLNLSGIYTYVEKNSNFPYVFVSINKIKNLSTFSKKIYLYSIGINVFDKNTTGSFVLNLIEDIRSLFLNISNFTTNNYNIIDIKFNEINTSLENDNTIWKSEIIFDFIISIN